MENGVRRPVGQENEVGAGAGRQKAGEATEAAERLPLPTSLWAPGAAHRSGETTGLGLRLPGLLL